MFIPVEVRTNSNVNTTPVTCSTNAVTNNTREITFPFDGVRLNPVEDKIDFFVK